MRPWKHPAAPRLDEASLGRQSVAGAPHDWARGPAGECLYDRALRRYGRRGRARRAVARARRAGHSPHRPGVMWTCRRCGAYAWLPACGSPHPSLGVLGWEDGRRTEDPLSCAEWAALQVLES